MLQPSTILYEYSVLIPSEKVKKKKKEKQKYTLLYFSLLSF